MMKNFHYHYSMNFHQMMTRYHLPVVEMNYYLQAVEVLLPAEVLPLVVVPQLRVEVGVVECLSVVLLLNLPQHLPMKMQLPMPMNLLLLPQLLQLLLQQRPMLLLPLHLPQLLLQRLQLLLRLHPPRLLPQLLVLILYYRLVDMVLRIHHLPIVETHHCSFQLELQF
jgi:hypothetical protein